MAAKEVEIDLDDSGNVMVRDIVSPQQEEPENLEGNEKPETDEPEVDTDEPSNDTNDRDGADDGGGDEPEVDTVDTEDEPEDNPQELDSNDEPSDDLVDYDELPESVQAYLDFYEDTKGSIEDFIKANQDWSKKPEDEVIAEFYKRQNPFLDAEDIEFELNEKFKVDEDLDEPDVIRRKKIAKKKFYSEALSNLKEQNEKYKTDLVSRKDLSPEAQEAIEFRKNYTAQREQETQSIAKKREFFEKETNRILGKDFKGFEVDLGDGKKATYKPENIEKTKQENLNVNNFLNKFTDKDGNIKDAVGYHRSLSIASDPEAFAKHFYEMGKADMADTDARTTKNIKMNPRQTQQPRQTGGFKVKAVEVKDNGQTSGSKPTIKLRNY